MAEDQYGFVIENAITNAPTNALNFTEIYQLVRDQFCSTVSKTTIGRWLTKLREEGVIDKDDKPRIRNEVYYSITPARNFERQLFGIEPKSREKVGLITSDNNLEEQEPIKKACLLILLQSALGTDVPDVATEPVLGAVYGFNPNTGREECLIIDKLPGVTMKEILEHKNIGLGGLFNHINFTQLLRKRDRVKIIQNALGLENNTIRRIIRNDEIAIEIVDDMVSMTPLKDFIKICACMTTWIHSRLRDTVTVALLNALYKKGNLTEIPPASFFSNFELEAFKSYLSLYGRKELNYQFKLCKELVDKLTENVVAEIQGSKNAIKKKMRELIEKRKDEITQTDKNIIAFYYGLIKCEKYVDAPVLKKYDRYKDYYEYVKRKMPEKYHHLTDTLMRVIYPSFLQRYHNTNPKLVEFKESLHTVDLDVFDLA